ncbi:MAG: DUF4169 family protein [Brevundimonas sp.]|nr:MAG: DUF4169 family protein [Brevundimonas sp.]
MGEIVSLNRARKTRAKAEDRAQAAANRVVHGRTKVEKSLSALDRQRADKLLDGQKRGPKSDD